MNGLIMAFAPRPDVVAGCKSLTLRARLRAVPVTMAREGIGFGLFFAVHASLCERWAPASSPATAGVGSDSHLAALGVSCAAGAVSGGVYHAVTYPIAQSQAVATPETSTGAVLQAARSRGVAALYRGAFRTSVSGIAVGAITFGVYDACLHMLVQ